MFRLTASRIAVNGRGASLLLGATEHCTALSAHGDERRDAAKAHSTAVRFWLALVRYVKWASFTRSACFRPAVLAAPWQLFLGQKPVMDRFQLSSTRYGAPTSGKCSPHN